MKLDFQNLLLFYFWSSCFEIKFYKFWIYLEIVNICVYSLVKLHSLIVNWASVYLQWQIVSVSIEYIPQSMHIVHALSCFVAVSIDQFTHEWCPSGLLHLHWGNRIFAPVPVRESWKYRGNWFRNNYELNKQSQQDNCCQVSNITCTKSQHLKYSPTVLRLSLPNPLKPGVKSRMKM